MRTSHTPTMTAYYPQDSSHPFRRLVVVRGDHRGARHSDLGLHKRLCQPGRSATFRRFSDQHHPDGEAEGTAAAAAAGRSQGTSAGAGDRPGHQHHDPGGGAAATDHQCDDGRPAAAAAARRRRPGRRSSRTSAPDVAGLLSGESRARKGEEGRAHVKVCVDARPARSTRSRPPPAPGIRCWTRPRVKVAKAHALQGGDLGGQASRSVRDTAREVRASRSSG